MSIRAYNKVIRKWTSTEDGSELLPENDWVINPTFSPDEATCMQQGPEFWTFDGSVISATPHAQWQAVMRQRHQYTMWLGIQTERDRRKWNGVKVGDKWYHTDDSSRIQHLAMVVMGNNLPPNLMWKTMDGTFTVMTPQLVQGIFGTIAAQDTALFMIAEQKRAAMMSLADPADFPDTYTGWPPTFGE